MRLRKKSPLQSVHRCKTQGRDRTACRVLMDNKPDPNTSWINALPWLPWSGCNAPHFYLYYCCWMQDWISLSQITLTVGAFLSTSLWKSSCISAALNSLCPWFLPLPRQLPTPHIRHKVRQDFRNHTSSSFSLILNSSKSMCSRFSI